MVDVVLAVWCAAWAAVAGTGLRRYASGASGGARAVRVEARVVRVEAPPPGARRSAGIPAVLAFRDAATGQELTVPTTAANGTLEAAWVGRRIEVRHPPGQPYRFRMLTRPGEGRLRGLALPVAAGLAVLAALLVRFSFEVGYGLALLGLGLGWTAAGALALRAGLREHDRRQALLATSATVPGEVVSVVEDESRDDDGHTHVTYTPVVAFTPAGGPTVTGVATLASSGPHHHRDTLGARVPVRHSVADPAVFHLQDSPERATAACGLVLLVLFTLGGAALTAVGAGALALS
jgi:hypothetical protein